MTGRQARQTKGGPSHECPQHSRHCARKVRDEVVATPVHPRDAPSVKAMPPHKRRGYFPLKLLKTLTQRRKMVLHVGLKAGDAIEITSAYRRKKTGLQMPPLGSAL